MNEQLYLEPLVRRWEAEGKWIDRGRWRRAKNGTLEYMPTKREIRDKCQLLRKLEGWRGAAKRSPRGGEFAVETTKGI